MKILFTRFPLESAFGGAEVQTLSLMEGLIARGYAVAFAGSCPVLLAECRKRGIPTVERQIGPPPVTAFGSISFAWRKERIRRALVALLEGFDETSDELWAMGYGKTGKTKAHSSQLTAICMLSLSEKLLLTDVAHRRGIKVLWIEHDRIGKWLSANPWLPRLKRLSALAVTVPVSRLSGTLYEALGWAGNTLHPIPNGIDPARLGAPFKRSRASAADPLRLGCIARLSPEKGVDVLIRAMADVPAHATLEIVGKGPQDTVLKMLVRELNLNDRVTFSAPNPDVRAVYERFDALVLPSSGHDPFGLVAAEAMMLGLPSIVTNLCGIADDLKHGEDALVVEGGSPSVLAGAITSLLNPSTFDSLAQSGRKTALEKFSVNRMVEEYERVLTVSVPPSR